MKILKFAEPLPRLVLSGDKDTTWRINDNKEISKGDKLSLCYVNSEEFGIAEVIWVKETIFSNITNEDLKGHEKFSSSKEMLDTYSVYYNMDVTLETKLKVIKFKLIKI